MGERELENFQMMNITTNWMSLDGQEKMALKKKWNEKNPKIWVSAGTHRKMLQVPTFWNHLNIKIFKQWIGCNFASWVHSNQYFSTLPYFPTMKINIEKIIRGIVQFQMNFVCGVLLEEQSQEDPVCIHKWHSKAGLPSLKLTSFQIITLGYPKKHEKFWFEYKVIN